jgi:hypothetical protein
MPQLKDFIETKFKERRKLQLRPIHTMALFLLPENRSRDMSSALDSMIMAFLWKQCKDDDDQKMVHKSFYAFRHKRDGFDMSSAWIHKDDPISFWQTFLSIPQHQELARIAVTIFETPANSVASERAFSCMGLITTAIRNRLKAERSTKLVYIHMNQRVLDANTMFQDWQEGDDEAQVELENILVQMEDEGDDDDVLGRGDGIEDVEIDDDNDIDGDYDVDMKEADN